MGAETRTFEGADGVRLVADVHGDPALPAVVFLHGGGQTRHAWGDAAERFAGEGFHTVTLDLRGHGDSGWSLEGNYGILRFVADLRAVLAQLPRQRHLPALVGASLGGITSLLAVGNAEHPIASRLVLVDIVPRINPEGARRIQGFMSANPEGFASVEEAADAVTAYMPHRPRPKDVSGLRKNLRLRDDRYFWHWDPRFILDQNIDPLKSQAMMEAATANVRIPTLLLKGSLSEIVNDEGREAFLRSLPRGEVVEVAGAGHMIAGDKNSAFDAAVLEFLRRTDGVNRP